MAKLFSRGRETAKLELRFMVKLPLGIALGRKPYATHEVTVMAVKPWILRLVGLMIAATLVLEPIYGPGSIPLILFAVAMWFACRRAITVLSREHAWQAEAIGHRHFL